MNTSGRERTCMYYIEVFERLGEEVISTIEWNSYWSLLMQLRKTSKGLKWCHQFKTKGNNSRYPYHPIKKFSPLTTDAEKVEHQTQEMILSVAELQRRFNSQFRQVGCAKIGALIGKKKWDCESCAGDIWVNSLETLQSLYFPESSDKKWLSPVSS